MTRVCAVLAGLLGILIQIQMSFMAERGAYLGLRLNLADLLLPFAGLYVLTALLRKKSRWPDWALPGAWIWLAALSVLMTAALFHGHAVTGEWSRWAIANKFTGWFIMLAYFCLGGWLAANGGSAARERFSACFAGAFCAVAACSLVVLYLSDAGVFSGGSFRPYPVSGLMGNRNAFAFLTVAVVVLAAHEDARKPGWIFPVLGFLLPVLFIETGSRTGWIVAAAMLSTLAVRNPPQFFHRLLPFMIAGAVLVAAIHGVTGKPFLRNKQFQNAGIVVDTLKGVEIDQKTRTHLYATSEIVRLRVLHDAVALWRAHPVAGAGLGSFLTLSYRAYAGQKRVIVDLIDCTPLWLLVETGVIGLALFAGFYGAILLALGRSRKGDPWAGTMMTVFLLFALMALAHEIMFTRYVWLLAGMALGMRATPPPR